MTNKSNKIVAIETSKKYPDCSREWTEEQVKDAFNFGQGTIEDLKEYAERNKAYCTFIFL